jgi:hypothetical protein
MPYGDYPNFTMRLEKAVARWTGLVSHYFRSRIGNGRRDRGAGVSVTGRGLLLLPATLLAPSP